ncbi:MAG: hypothetical protein ACRD3C_23585 [Vicinamibacterales bacterium]
MDYKRLALAAVVTWVVDSIYALVVWMNMLGGEFARHPGVFRSEAAMNANTPLMLAGGLLAMFALVYMYAKGYEGGSGVQEGLRFGLLLAIFMTGFVSIFLYASLNVDGRIGVLTSIASFVELLLVGAVIGVMYKPAARPSAARAARV